MSETTLLPCPFCGGKAKAIKGLHAFNDVSVHCLKCGTEGPLFDCDDGETGQYTRNKTAAVAAWNRRSPSPVAQESGK